MVVITTKTLLHAEYVLTFIIWLRQTTHADWLISSPEKVVLPAQEIHLARSRNSSSPLVYNIIAELKF